MSITIDTYTANAERKGRNARAGSHVRIHIEPDAREYDDFHRGLSASGLEAEEHVRFMPRLKCDIYRISRKK